MTRKALQEAIAEAKRFIDHATAAVLELDDEKRDMYYAGTRTSGSARRASMDLTRSLTDLRRSTRYPYR